MLLLGDDYYDAGDQLGYGGVSFIPSLIAWDGSKNWGRIPSENLYADLDGDHRPDVAIGRLPVRTAEQALAMADKVAGQTAALAVAPGTHVLRGRGPGARGLAVRRDGPDMAGKLPSAYASRFADVAKGISPRVPRCSTPGARAPR